MFLRKKTNFLLLRKKVQKVRIEYLGRYLGTSSQSQLGRHHTNIVTLMLLSLRRFFIRRPKTSGRVSKAPNRHCKRATSQAHFPPAQIENFLHWTLNLSFSLFPLILERTLHTRSVNHTTTIINHQQLQHHHPTQTSAPISNIRMFWTAVGFQNIYFSTGLDGVNGAVRSRRW